MSQAKRNYFCLHHKITKQKEDFKTMLIKQTCGIKCSNLLDNQLVPTFLVFGNMINKSVGSQVLMESKPPSDYNVTRRTSILETLLFNRNVMMKNRCNFAIII